MSESFLPEFSVVAYAAVSVLLCLLVYRARLATYAWGTPSMSQPVGSGRVRQVDLGDGSAEDLARGTATMTANLANTMTPGGMASIVVLIVWLLSGFLGVTVGPAILGAMSRPSTANVLLVAVAGLCIAFAMARLTLTLISLTLGLAVLALVFGAIAAVAVYFADFLSGGTIQAFRKLQDWHKEFSIEKSVGLERGGTTRKRAEFNWCVMSNAISLVGDMDATRNLCVPGWRESQEKIAAEEKAAREKLFDEGEAARVELRDWAKRNAHGFPFKDMPLKNQSLTGNWIGRMLCDDKSLRIFLTTQGDDSSAKGVMHVFRAKQDRVFYELGMPKNASTYRIELHKAGDKVTLRVGETLLAGKGTPAIEGTFVYELSNVPGLVRPSTRPDCKGTIYGFLEKGALKPI